VALAHFVLDVVLNSWDLVKITTHRLYLDIFGFLFHLTDVFMHCGFCVIHFVAHVTAEAFDFLVDLN
jgi:hypothetical protein